MIDNDGNKHARQCLRITTSPLRFGRQYCVKDALMATHPGLTVELVPMVTSRRTPIPRKGGDCLLKSLNDAGENALILPYRFPDGLGLVTICEREDPARRVLSPNVSQPGRSARG